VRLALSSPSSATAVKNGAGVGFQAERDATMAAGEIANSPTATSAGHGPNHRLARTKTMPTLAPPSSAMNSAAANGSSQSTSIGNASR
jgi:hypothetical protein